MKRNYIISFLALFIALGTLLLSGSNPQNSKDFLQDINATVLYEQDFTGNSLPQGWINTDVTASGHVWLFENEYARATSDFEGSGDVHVHSRLISSAFDFSALEIVKLAMEHRYLSWMAQRGRLKISTDNENWSIIKEYSSTTGPALAWEEFDISQWAAGEETVYLQWEFDDNQVFGYHWTLNHMILFTPYDNDLNAVTLSGSAGPVAGEINTYGVNIRNEGGVVQDDYLVNLYDTESNLIGSQPGIALGYMEEHVFEFEWIPQEPGITHLYGYVALESDQIPDNNYTPNFTVNIQTLPTNSVIVGDSTGVSTQLPLAFGALSSLSQTLYFENELQGGGLITTIGYRNSFTNEPVNNTPVKIWIAETNEENLNNGWLPVENMPLVYDSLVSFPMGDNMIYINLSEPFLYGGGNLVITVMRPLAMWGFGGTGFVMAETPAQPNRTRRTTSSQAIDPNNPSPGVLTNQLAQTTFFLVQAGLGGLSGTITSTEGNTLHSAMIEIEGTSFSTLSAADGTYQFPWLLAGEYEIIVSRNGYLTTTVEVEVTEDDITTLDIALEPLEEVALSGYVFREDNHDVPVGGATVRLQGMNDFEQVTYSDGFFSIDNLYGNQSYDVVINAPGFLGWSGQIQLGAEDETVEFFIREYPVPSLAVEAQAGITYAHVNWTDPNLFSETAIVLDDGTGQNGFSSAPGYNMWLGNKYLMNGPAMIRSIDVYGLPHPYGWNREVTLQLFDEDRNHIFTTQEFIIEPNEWVTVELPAIPVEGTFYAMVHWDMFTVNTHHVGFDQTGPNVDKEFGYFYDGDEWYLMHLVTQGDPGVFMIRVNAFVGDTDRLLTGLDIQAGNKSQRELLHFELLRRMPGNNAEDQPWELIMDELAALEFYDHGWYELEEGVYEYGVKAVYSDDNVSEIRTSQPLEKNLVSQYEITFNIIAQEEANATIQFTHTDDMEGIVYNGEADMAGNLVFPQVYEGIYDLLVTLEGYQEYAETGITVNENKVLEISLIPTSLEEISSNFLQVFPNPATEYLHVVSDRTIDQVVLVDAEGRVVLEQPVNKSSTRLQVSNLSQGVYLLRIVAGKDITSKQVLINR